MIRSLVAWKNLVGFMIGLLSLVAVPAFADWRSALPGARLIGQADFTRYGFDVYQARLWSAAPSPSLDTAFALELDYRRSIGKETLVQTSLEEMQRINGTPLDTQQLDAWRSHMRLAFVDVKPGSRITGVYLPGQGCRFYVGEQLSQAIDDPPFARAFFYIWLDSKTQDKKLRKQLLGL
jgi:hypothetical protein